MEPSLPASTWKQTAWGGNLPLGVSEGGMVGSERVLQVVDERTSGLLQRQSAELEGDRRKPKSTMTAKDSDGQHTREMRDRSIEISSEENDAERKLQPLSLRGYQCTIPLPPSLQRDRLTTVAAAGAPTAASSQNSTQPQLNQHTVAAAC
jgi:hypothetical protein